MNFDSPCVVIRPALPLDREAVLEFCKFIWDGHDYIPYVWDDWLADPDGEMFVAEYAGKAVGLGRLTLLAPGQWWLEGLRVDPAYQGRKIGSLMNDYINALWLERGEGVVRLLTSSQRVQVHHLCERQGFVRVGERAFHTAEPLAAQTSELPWMPVAESEIPEAVRFALEGETRSMTSPFVDVGWRFATPTDELFREFMGRAETRIYWWRGRDGLLLAREDDWDEGRFLLVSLVACLNRDLTALLLDLRALAARDGFHAVGWNANLVQPLADTLAEAGFSREDDHSGYLFERPHPTRP
jgi:GNAT superfamily N-acetyltransferase